MLKTTSLIANNRNINKLVVDIIANLKLPFLIVIHGLGKGVLKSKITKFLKDNDASFFEESPLFYKGGATRINLF